MFQQQLYPIGKVPDEAETAEFNPSIPASQSQLPAYDISDAKFIFFLTVLTAHLQYAPQMLDCKRGEIPLFVPFCFLSTSKIT